MSNNQPRRSAAAVLPQTHKRNLATICILIAVIILHSIMTPAVTFAASQQPLTLSCNEKTLEIGDQMYLSAYSSNGKNATFKSNRPSVASVSRSGKITAKAAGTAKITASIGNYTATCTIHVKKTTVQICTSGIYIEKKGSYRLRATASNHSNITWRSKDPTIATVSATGVVTGKRPGKAVIIASAGGSSASCTVTVKTPRLLLNKTTLTLAPKASTSIVATASNGMRPVWSSSNPSVAAVSSDGIITAYKKGSATITATVDGVRAHCRVTVK